MEFDAELECVIGCIAIEAFEQAETDCHAGRRGPGRSVRFVPFVIRLLLQAHPVERCKRQIEKHA
jgi:hypothetical protein